jgi:hypothetical protein
MGPIRGPKPYRYFETESLILGRFPEFFFCQLLLTGLAIGTPGPSGASCMSRDDFELDGPVVYPLCGKPQNSRVELLVCRNTQM